MPFQISDELKKKIEVNFKDANNFRVKLLSGDVDAIHKLAIISHQRIKPEDIIEAYESDNMDMLYSHAKKMVHMQEIYKELCDAYDISNSQIKTNNLEER